MLSVCQDDEAAKQVGVWLNETNLYSHDYSYQLQIKLYKMQSA